MKYFINRVLHSLPTLLGVSVLTFFIIRWIPGDPVQILLGERGGDPETIQQLRASLGLDKSLLTQYFIYLKNILSGDFGTSIVSRQPVLNEFFSRFPATFELGVLALFFSSLLGVLVGIIAAVNRSKIWDYLLMSGALVGYSMPIFWWGLLLILFFAVQLGLLPVSGRINVLYDIEVKTGFMLIDAWWSEEPVESFLSACRHLVLPALALGTIPLAAIARMTRSSLLEVLNQDYIRTAKSKGLTYYRIILKHGLKNALIPIITIVGLMFSSLLTGAVLTETIFSWPGIGRWMVMSIDSRDYPVIQSGVLLISCLVIMVNIFVDSLYSFFDPRLKEE